MEFHDKKVLVTGGSRGIGAAISKGFAERGAEVIVNFQKDKTRAEALVKSLPGSGHGLIQANVGTIDGCKHLIDQAMRRFGKIDILINNAGIHETHPIDQITYDDWNRIWQETLEVNLMGPARLMYLVAQEMGKSGGGRIVNVSSRGAFRGEPDQPAYGASKGGLNALSQSLAQKLAPDEIFIGIVAPGFVETDLAKDILEGPMGDDIRNQSPLHRVAKPEEVAYAVLFLAAEESKFSTGTIIDVNGASYLRS